MFTAGQPGFVDIHNHCLFGIDDGAERFEETCNMLRAAAMDNVSIIVTTPHIIPGKESFPYEKYLQAFRQAGQYILDNQLGLRLVRGHEILYTNFTAQFLREGGAFTIGNTDAVLLEFNPDESLHRINEASWKLLSNGFRPILAHAERYYRISKIEHIRQLREEGVEIQINAHSLIRKHSRRGQQYIDELIQSRLADYVASDTHGCPGRESCMTQAYQTLSERYGTAEALRLCRDNPLKLIKE